MSPARQTRCQPSAVTAPDSGSSFVSRFFPLLFVCLIVYGVFLRQPRPLRHPLRLGSASKRGPAARGSCAELGAEIPVFHSENPRKLLHGRPGQGRGRDSQVRRESAARDLRGIFTPSPGNSPPSPGWNPCADLFSIREPSPESAAKGILGFRWVLGTGEWCPR